MIKSKSRTIVYGIIMIIFMALYCLVYCKCGVIIDFAKTTNDQNLEMIYHLNMMLIYFLPFLTTLWLRKGSDLVACIGSVLWFILLIVLEQFVSFVNIGDTIIKTPIFTVSTSESMFYNTHFRLMVITSIFFTSSFALIINWARVNVASTNFGANFGRFMLSLVFSCIPFSIASIVDSVVYDLQDINTAKIVWIILLLLSLLFMMLRINKIFNKKTTNHKSKRIKNGNFDSSQNKEDSKILIENINHISYGSSYANNHRLNDYKNESFKKENDDKPKIQ